MPASTGRAIASWSVYAYILGNVVQLLVTPVAAPLTAARSPAAGAAAGPGSPASPVGLSRTATSSSAPGSGGLLAAHLPRAALLAAVGVILECQRHLPDSIWHSALPLIWVRPAGPPSAAGATGAGAPGTPEAVASTAPGAVAVPMPQLLLSQLRMLSRDRLAKLLARTCCAVERAALRTPRLRLPDDEDPEAGSYDAHAIDVGATGAGAGRDSALAAAPSLATSLLRGAWETSRLALSFFARGGKRASGGGGSATSGSSGGSAPGGSASDTAAAAAGSPADRSAGGSSLSGGSVSGPAGASGASSGSAGRSGGAAFDGDAFAAFIRLYAPLLSPRPVLAGPASAGGIAVDSDPIIGRIHLLNALAYAPSLQLARALWCYLVETTDFSRLLQDRAYKGTWSLHALPDAAVTLFATVLGHLLAVVDEFELYSRHVPLPLRELRHAARLLRDILAHAEGIGADTPATLGGSGSKGEVVARLSAPPGEGWQRFAGAAGGVLRMLYDRHCLRPLGPPSMWLIDCSRVALTMPPAATEFAVAGPAASASGGRSGAAAAAATTTWSTRHLSPQDAAVQALLRTMPFAVPFETRATLFEAARQAEHARCQRGLPQVPITVRRDMLFESAYGALAGVRGDAMRRKVAVTFINAEGVPESGLDAGGLFKELLTELCKLVFDEAYGLFKANAQGELYPNPASHLCTGTPDAQSFEFVGRLVGKALFEGITIGPQFARFFLHKLLGRPLNLHYLPSLDPELYRSLMFLKGYEGDVGDLALTFTVTPELGEGIPTAGGASGAGGGAGGGSGAVTDTGEVELVPGGRGIAVTAANRLSYIYAIANWRLSTSIQRQCDAFLRGMRDVLPASWLAPFSAPELQVLLSGSQRGVDVADLQAHTEYVGGFWVHDSTIRAFWSVVADFSERDRAALLKFVTAAERAPPNGFQQLQPPFTIAKLDMRGRPGGADELLPMASTCFNVLKLPPYSDKKTLRRQLLTAIHSGAGFELT